MKQCFKCKLEKNIDEFYVHKQMADGHLGKCKACTRLDVSQNLWGNREYYRQYDQKRHRENIERLIQHRYGGMRNRVLGIGIRKHSVLGKELCSFDEFRGWVLEEKNLRKLKRLMVNWKKAKYPRKLSPSVDRIDNTKGYSIENLQWMTQSQNSRKYTF